MEKVTFYVGLNDKDSKVQEINTIDAYKIAQRFVCDFFEAGTISEAEGIWRHYDSSAIVTEKTLRIEVINFDIKDFDKKVKEFCEIIKKAFNQEAIAVQFDTIKSELI